MSDRDTAARLQAALRNRAENAMSSTNTSRELERLHAAMRPVRAERRRRMLVAAAAAVAIIGTGIGLGVGLAGGGHATHRIAPGKQTAPAGFPQGIFTRPDAPHQQLELTTTAAVLRPALEHSALSFPAPGQVQFSCIAGNHSPCLSPCRYTYHASGGTVEFQLVARSPVCRSNDFLARAPWHATG